MEGDIFINRISRTLHIGLYALHFSRRSLTPISGTNGKATSFQGQTIAGISPGYYDLSDATMDIFGPDFPIKYRFTDICGNFTADGASVDFGTQIKIRFNPGAAVDLVAGEVTFHIEYISPGCCGLLGIKTVYKVTPK